MGIGEKNSVDRAVDFIPHVFECVKVVRGGRRWSARHVLLRREDVAFCASERQVEGGSSPGVDTVEVRFGGSKSNQIRAEMGRAGVDEG